MSAGKWFLTLLLSVAVASGTLAAYWRVLNFEPLRSTSGTQSVPTEAPLQPASSLSVTEAVAAAEASESLAAAGASADAGADTAEAVQPAPAATPAPAVAAVPTQPAGVKVVISSVFKPGQRTLEYVLLVNEAGPVDMTGWTLETPAGTIYTFPSFVLFGNTFVRVYTMNGTDAPTTLFLNRAEPLWTPGDEVLLKNGGVEMARYTVK